MRSEKLMECRYIIFFFSIDHRLPQLPIALASTLEKGKNEKRCIESAMEIPLINVHQRKSTGSQWGSQIIAYTWLHGFTKILQNQACSHKKEQVPMILPDDRSRCFVVSTPVVKFLFCPTQHNITLSKSIVCQKIEKQNRVCNGAEHRTQIAELEHSTGVKELFKAAC